MEITTFEEKFIDYIETNVIMKFFSGFERFKILFGLPFKIKEIENQLIGNSTLLQQMGFMQDNCLNISKLYQHTIKTAKKCEFIKITIESKDITFTAEDIEKFFRSLGENLE